MIPNTSVHARAWSNAEEAWEAQIMRARPAPGSHRRETDYPTAVVAAIAAWDKEMKNR